MKIEAEVSKGAVDNDNKGAVRVILTTPKEVVDPKRVTMGGGYVTFRKKD